MWGTSQPFVSLHSFCEDCDWQLQGRVQGYPCELRIVRGRNSWAKKLRCCRCSDQSWMCTFRSQTCCYRWEGMAKSQSWIYLTVKAGPRNLISELGCSLHCCWTDSSPEPSLGAEITENRQSCLQGIGEQCLRGVFAFCLLACLLRRALSMEPWLTWNLFCERSWPGTHRDLLPLPSEYREEKYVPPC